MIRRSCHSLFCMSEEKTTDQLLVPLITKRTDYTVIIICPGLFDRLKAFHFFQP